MSGWRAAPDPRPSGAGFVVAGPPVTRARADSGGAGLVVAGPPGTDARADSGASAFRADERSATRSSGRNALVGSWNALAGPERARRELDPEVAVVAMAI